MSVDIINEALKNAKRPTCPPAVVRAAITQAMINHIEELIRQSRAQEITAQQYVRQSFPEGIQEFLDRAFYDAEIMWDEILQEDKNDA